MVRLPGRQIRIAAQAQAPAWSPDGRRLAYIARGRGRQSEALYVVSPGAGYGGGSDVACDLRVDDHPDPVGELRRLLDVHELLFGTPDPDTLLDLSGELGQEVQSLTTALGYASLDMWAGVENLENRLVPGRIDPVVLTRLREAASLEKA